MACNKYCMLDGITLSIQKPLVALLDDVWGLFAVSDGGTADIYVSRDYFKSLNASISTMDIEHYNRVFKDNKITILTSRNYSEVVLVGESTRNAKFSSDRILKLLNMVVYSYCSTHHTTLLRGSLVSDGKHGVLFLGENRLSVAEQWAKCTNGKIINGQYVYVARKRNVFYGYGTPWHGESSYCLNEKVAVSQIVYLESGIGKIQEIVGDDKLPYVLNNTVLPVWYEKGFEKVCETTGELFGSVPVYHLTYQKEEEAISLLQEKTGVHQ